MGTVVAFVFVLAGFQGHPWIETARLALVLLTSAVSIGVPAMLAVTTNLAPLLDGPHIAYQRVLTWVPNKISSRRTCALPR